MAKTKRNATATTSATRFSARNGVPASRPASTFPGGFVSAIEERVPAGAESKLGRGGTQRGVEQVRNVAQLRDLSTSGDPPGGLRDAALRVRRSGRGSSSACRELTRRPQTV